MIKSSIYGYEQLEESLRGLVIFAKGAYYSFRVASKRVGDMPGAMAAKGGKGELTELVASLSGGEDQLSDVLVLAVGDHFRAFINNCLGGDELVALPGTPEAIEQLTSTPGAIKESPLIFRLMLQLYPATLAGGPLTRANMVALGMDSFELTYPGGKVKMFTVGDRITFTETHVADLAEAVLEVARNIKAKMNLS